MDIYTATKAGDLQRVKHLVEVEDIDINEKNEFDAIPLFYACLCGHKELVEYYLDKGAVLDANTFEGWRCYYAALTLEIHQILRDYKAKPRDLNRLVENLRTLFNDSNQNTEFQLNLDMEDTSHYNFSFPDVTFVVEGRPIRVHRFLLAANSAYFDSMFHTKWRDRKTIAIRPKKKGVGREAEDYSHLLKYEAFEALMLYFYTNSVNLSMEYVDSFLLLCKQCKLYSLFERAEIELGPESKRHKKKRLIIVPSEEDGEMELVTNLRDVARSIIKGEAAVFPDVRLQVEQENEGKEETRRFEYHSHKGLLSHRSEYFRPLLSGNFRENANNFISFDLQNTFSAEVFEMLIEYLYTDGVQSIDESDRVLDLLSAANLLLLPDLKKICVSAIIKHVDLTNVYELLLLSEFFDSYRLREYCLHYTAMYLDEIWDTEEFHDFVVNKSTPALEQMLKEAIEEHLVHYGQTPKWKEIEDAWGAKFVRTSITQ